MTHELSGTRQEHLDVIAHQPYHSVRLHLLRQHDLQMGSFYAVAHRDAVLAHDEIHPLQVGDVIRAWDVDAQEYRLFTCTGLREIDFWGTCQEDAGAVYVVFAAWGDGRMMAQRKNADVPPGVGEQDWTTLGLETDLGK